MTTVTVADNVVAFVAAHLHACGVCGPARLLCDDAETLIATTVDAPAAPAAKSPQPPFVHRLALVDPSVRLGAGVAVWAFASVHADVTLGDHVGVGEHAYVGIGTVVGEGTRIGSNTHVTDHMVVGSRCFLGAHAIFCNDRYPIANNPRYRRESPVVEDDVSVGVNATILPGVRLGRGCRVGAGAVVTRDVPSHVTVVGNPARRLVKGAARG